MGVNTKRELQQKRAKEMFLSGKYQQKEIAELVGIAENTVGRWAEKFKWKILRANMTTSKESVLAQYYGQLAEINANIERREEGNRYANSKEADSIIKISAAIKKLEVEAGISEIVACCIGLCNFIKEYDVEGAKSVSEHCNAYIESKIK